MKLSSHTILSGLALLGSAFSSHAVLLSDFDGGGIAYATGQVEGPGAPGIQTGGPTGSYYQLLSSGSNSNRNYVSFEQSGSTAGWTAATFTMDLRADNLAADGFSVSFLGVDTHGASGVLQAGTTGLDSSEERGHYSDSIGVGFRTFNGTNATVNYSGAESGDVAYPVAQGAWASLEIHMDRDLAGNVLLDATLYQGTGQTGAAAPVFTDYAIAGVTLEEFRMQIAGRTGGAAMDLDVDNLNLSVVTIPEPGSALLVGLAGFAIMFRRKRR